VGKRQFNAHEEKKREPARFTQLDTLLSAGRGKASLSKTRLRGTGTPRFVLTIDDHPSRLVLVSSTFPKLEEMKQGLGDILLNFKADVPHGGANRKFTFENHHQSAISVDLVNCLLPSDQDIGVTSSRPKLRPVVFPIGLHSGRSFDLTVHHLVGLRPRSP
jgi:hypothetical protein